MSKNAAVKLYLENGFTLFDLNGKVPPKGLKWSEAQFNPLYEARGNFGVKLAEDDLVLDVDPRHFPVGRNSLVDLQKDIGFNLRNTTFLVRTGGGGFHIYFKKDPEFSVKGAIKELPGIEVKSRGQYVVGAGSIHPDTKKVYEILYDGVIAVAPPNLLDMLKKVDITPVSGLAHYVDDQQTKDRFIHYLATAPIAIEGAAGDKTTFTVAAVAHDFGLHPDLAFELMSLHYNVRCEPPWSEQELRKKVYNAYQYSAGSLGSASAEGQFEGAEEPPDLKKLRLDQYGRIQKSLFNNVLLFNHDMPDLLAYNSFSKDIVFKKAAPWHRSDEVYTCWKDDDSARCKYWLSAERKYEPAVTLIEESIVSVAQQHAFHPIKDYLEKLQWDGFPRLHTWMSKFLGAELNEYTKAVGLKLLVAAVTRLYRPGHKFDYVPVLEGPQGIGKSRALAVLGGEWFGDITLNVHDRDTIDVMRHLWIIELSEMETQRRTEAQALKSFLSRSEDICRLAYGRASESFPRHSVFVGTINPELDEDAGWMKDTTGNRRFWPIKCGKIEISQLRAVRDQLWAEAYLYYQKNTALHFEDTKIEQLALAEQEKRMGRDPWFERIEAFVISDIVKNKEVLTGEDLFMDCLNGRPMGFTRECQKRIAMIMRVLMWEKGVFWDAKQKKSIRGYRRPPMNGEELGL